MDKDYLSQAEENGSINISEEVIGKIATAAATEVEGVSGFSGNFCKSIIDRFGKKSSLKGVKILKEDDGLTICVSVLAKYGFPVRDIAEKVQKSVAAAVRDMSGFSVKEVNVDISGVSFEK